MKINSARHVRSAFDRESFLGDPLPQIAFVGRSNVGKSSLLNRLLGRRDLARTSRTPGRTRAVNYFLVDSKFYFVDLPGYGYAKVAKSERRQWSDLMDQFFRFAPERTRAIQLVDAKVGATPLDRQSMDYLVSLGYRPAVVATRADRVAKSRRRQAAARVRDELGLDAGWPVLPASARTGEGIREVETSILQAIESIRQCGKPSEGRP
ncbi:MAG: ribosome biogenesis GTP-binding protein YihA/YsxC [Thermoanaerobaculia bacterium]|nr:ribosome biogenesis GTP-binding protein YihA/YsxC [Thermoanaerobaculia bacterium]